MGTVALIVALGMLEACDEQCVEGSTQACVCTGGQSGTQRCNGEGSFDACDCGLLSEDDALAILRADQTATRATCQLQVNEFATRRYSMYSSDRECRRQLAQAGLVDEGDCVGSGLCPEVEITALGDASFDRIYLEFPCGTIEVLNVVAVTTEGQQATIDYRRSARVDEARVAQLSACRLRVPESGEAQRQRRARRSDSGTWSLLP